MNPQTLLFVWDTPRSKPTVILRAPGVTACVNGRVYRFDDFTLDCSRFELLRGEQSLKMERKPMELLILLAAKEGGLVTRAEIAGQLWEREVFVDTEHGINTAIRKVRQALRDDSEQPRYIQTVTGKGYRFIGAVTNPPSPEAVEAAEQVFEPTKSSPGDMSAAIVTPTWNPASRSVLWIGWGAVALVSVAFLVGAGLRGRSTHGTQMRSLAVLPLDNLSGEPGQDYVAAGITDELITMLAKDSTLRITSRTSVMQFKGAHRPLRDIAHDLGVDAIVEGSVSKAGSTTQVRLQLIEADTDTHLWAEKYTRDPAGLVFLPEEASLQIARRLMKTVPHLPSPQKVDPAAHDAYLRGRYLWYTDHTQESGPFFKRATQLQPDYALAWSGLAIYYGASAVKGELSPAASVTETEDASRRALQLDATLPEAHLAAAGAALVRWDLGKADSETSQAITLDSQFAEAYHLRAKILAAQNRQDEAIAAQRKATEIDPFTRPWAMPLAYLEARRFDAALRDADERLTAFPNNVTLVWLTHLIYERQGLQRQSVDALAKSLALRGHADEALQLRHTFAKGGYHAVLAWQMEGMARRATTGYVSPVELASLNARTGRPEEALKLLEVGYRQRATRMLWIGDDPAFDCLHADNRYRSLVERVGLPPAS